MNETSLKNGEEAVYFVSFIYLTMRARSRTLKKGRY